MFRLIIALRVVTAICLLCASETASADSITIGAIGTETLSGSTPNCWMTCNGFSQVGDLCKSMPTGAPGLSLAPIDPCGVPLTLTGLRTCETRSISDSLPACWTTTDQCRDDPVNCNKSYEWNSYGSIEFCKQDYLRHTCDPKFYNAICIDPQLECGLPTCFSGEGCGQPHNAAAVPAPSSISLLGVGGVLLLAARIRLKFSRAMQKCPELS
jgi:hypothetical protein